MKRGRKAKPHETIGGTEHKWCGGCSDWKPLDAFEAARPSKPTWDGKRFRCVACTSREQRASRQKYDARNKARPASTDPQRCGSCRETKPASEFHRCATRPNGLAVYCKPCARAYTGARAKLESVKAVRSRWAATKGKDVVRRYKSRWPAKQRARILVHREVQAGRLVNPRVCSACSGTERVEAHHDDYAQPYEVRWLCRLCHRAWHRINGQGRNAASSR
jgi:hypothetical protein